MEHFETFQALMDEYNEAFTSAETEKDQASVEKKYELKISAAEKVLEEAIEKEFEEQNAALEAEQKALEEEILKQEKKDEEEEKKDEEEEKKDPYALMTADEMRKAYKKSENIAKAKELGLPFKTKMKEIEICELLYTYFND